VTLSPLRCGGTLRIVKSTKVYQQSESCICFQATFVVEISASLKPSVARSSSANDVNSSSCGSSISSRFAPVVINVVRLSDGQPATPVLLATSVSGVLCADALFTFRVRRSRGEMYSGHGRLCVCVYADPLRIPTLLYGPRCNLEE